MAGPRVQLDAYPSYSLPIRIGTVTTLPAGSVATADIGIDAQGQFIDLGIPVSADLTALTAAVAAAVAAQGGAQSALGSVQTILAQVQALAATYPTLIPTSYLGQVATRCFVPQTFGAASNLLCRSRHVARDTMVSPAFEYSNWIVDFPNGGVEAEPGAGMNISLALEYPVGTYTRVTWGGAAAGVIGSGQSRLSDVVPITIPKGATFFLRAFTTPVTGSKLPYIEGTVAAGTGGTIGPLTNTTLGDAFTANASGDLTMSGTIPDEGSGRILAPTAIVAQTTRPGLIFFGDSIVEGMGGANQLGDDPGLFGQLGREFGYTNAGIGGDQAQWFAVNNAKRLALAKRYFTHAIVGYGTNDINTGNRTQAQLSVDFITIWNVLNTAGLKVFQSTILPKATSTDSFATAANQTAATTNTVRVQTNLFLRSKPAPVTEVLDMAEIVEAARDRGIWQQMQGANVTFTGDGTHPNYYGYARLASARPINLAMIRRP